MSIKDEVIRAQKKMLALGAERYNPKNASYLRCYQDNLICPMDEAHQNQYGKGSGGELEGELPKMASVRSSSAMTFNLLGNWQTGICANEIGLPEGDYEIEF